MRADGQKEENNWIVHSRLQDVSFIQDSYIEIKMRSKRNKGMQRRNQIKYEQE
jgi:hypothetical protein